MKDCVLEILKFLVHAQNKTGVCRKHEYGSRSNSAGKGSGVSRLYGLVARKTFFFLGGGGGVK